MSAELMTYQMGIMPNIDRESIREPPADSESESESRWFELFGTPEMAAETIAKTIHECDGQGWHCDDCPFHLAPVCPNDALLEWLRGDAE